MQRATRRDAVSESKRGALQHTWGLHLRLDLHALHDVRWLRLHLRVRGHRLHGRHLHFDFLALAKAAMKGHSKRNDNRQTD